MIFLRLCRRRFPFRMHSVGVIIVKGAAFPVGGFILCRLQSDDTRKCLGLRILPRENPRTVQHQDRETEFWKESKVCCFQSCRPGTLVSHACTDSWEP